MNKKECLEKIKKYLSEHFKRFYKKTRMKFVAKITIGNILKKYFIIMLKIKSYNVFIFIISF